MTATFDFPDNQIVVELVSSDEQLKAAFDVRFEVFVGEQNVPAEEEIDALDTDPTTTHILARDANSGEVLATSRLLPTPGHLGHFHVGRVAVRQAARGRNVGAAMMATLERIALAQTGNDVVLELSAQVQAGGFYKKVGYEQSSQELYLDAGIWHIDMKKVISF